jgi:hypothetical protein
MKIKLTKNQVLNFTFSFFFNILNVFFLLLTNFILPILLKFNFNDFGYFQLYLLFVSFSGLFHFGILDGAMIVFTSKSYREDFPKFYFPIVVRLILIEIFIFLILLIISTVIYSGIFRSVFQFSILNLVILIPKAAFLTYFNIQKRLDIYYMFEILQKIIFLSGFLFLYLVTRLNFNFFYLIILDLTSKLIPLFVAFTFLFKKFIGLGFRSTFNFELFKQNLFVGFPIMISSIINISSISIIKFIFAGLFSIDLFSNFTILFGISNFVFLVFNFFYLYFVPLFRSTSILEPKKVYFLLKGIISLVLLFSFLFYDYFVYIFSLFFSDSFVFLDYLFFIFPFLLFGILYNVATNIYVAMTMKQNLSLKVNFFVFFLEVLFFFIGIYFFNYIEYYFIVIVFSLFLKFFLNELIVSFDYFKTNFYESILLFFTAFSFLLFKLNILEFEFFLIGFFLYALSFFVSIRRFNLFL